MCKTKCEFLVKILHLTFYLTKGKYIHPKYIIQDKVLIVDLECIGVFYADSGEIVAIEKLDNINSKSDIKKLKKRIIELLSL